MGPAAILAEATDFAARAHVDRCRKGHKAEPYINHLTDVTVRLARSRHGDDVELLVAGILHDTVEDTDVTREQIVSRFGEPVAALVMEVTDDKTLSKKQRKQAQVEHTAHKSERARLIKLADKTSNVLSLVTSPPKEWDRKTLAAYVDWAESVVASCRGLDDLLEAEFDRAAEKARTSIAQRHPLSEDAA